MSVTRYKAPDFHTTDLQTNVYDVMRMLKTCFFELMVFFLLGLWRNWSLVCVPEVCNSQPSHLALSLSKHMVCSVAKWFVELFNLGCLQTFHENITLCARTHTHMCSGTHTCTQSRTYTHTPPHKHTHTAHTHMHIRTHVRSHKMFSMLSWRAKNYWNCSITYGNTCN